jgi:ABC-type glycerol-3-phosphate transport system substrate-binding protein
MKKLLATILAALLLLSTLAGCKGGETETPDEQPADEQITLTFFTNRTDYVADGTFDAYEKEFQKEYPNVDIDFQGLTDYDNDLLVLINGNEYGDICMIPNGVDSTEYANYFTSFGTVDELKDKYVESYLTGGAYYDGQVYGLANFASVDGVVYNKKVFEAAGYTDENLPKTPEEFIEMLKAIKEKTDAIPYYTNTQAGWTLGIWEDLAVVAGVGDADYKNNGITADKDAFAPGSALYTFDKILYDIVAEGLCEEDPFTSDWEACKGMLNRGEIGCMALGNWSITQMKDADEHPEDIGYMPFPYTVDGVQYVKAGCDKCYGVSVNSEHQEEAKAFVDFMLNKSGMAQKSGGISIVVGDPMPAGLELFGDTTSIVPTPEKEVGKLSKIQADADISIGNGDRISKIVTAAKEGASYDDLLAEWAGYWAEAVEANN